MQRSIRKSLRSWTQQPVRVAQLCLFVGSTSALVLFPFAALAGQSAAQQAAMPPKKIISFAAGNQWTYAVRIPKDVHLIVDPYFVNDDAVIRTSKTNGVLAKPRGPEEFTFTMKCVQAISDSSCKAEVDRSGVRLWILNEITEARLAVLPRGSFQTIELHGVTHFGEKQGNPWILGQVLGLLLAQPNPQKVDLRGWLVEREPLVETTNVPAGQFSEVFHSRIRKPSIESGPSAFPGYTIESWVALRVGLVKFVMKDADAKVLFSLELVSYEVK